MKSVVTFFLVVIAPALAILLGLLGLETLSANPLGWFLLVTGVVYTAGVVIVYHIRKERFWESALSGATTHEEHGNLSYWLFTASMILVFYLSPIEYLYLTPRLPRPQWLPILCTGLIILGIVLFVWARRTLHAGYTSHVSVKSDQPLVHSGPYHLLRHPAYAGYLLMALAVSLGYSSLFGLVTFLVLLLPSLVYRIRVEEKILTEHFGEEYRQYTRTTRRLIPGIW